MDGSHPLLSDLLDRLELALAQPVDFTATDTASTLEKVTEFCLRVSAGEIRDIGEIAAQLRHFWRTQG